MSSSTTGVLGRGKLGATGEGLGTSLPRHDSTPSRPTLATYGTSFTNRRPSGTSPTPQLFDFAKTDRRTTSLQTLPDMELDMAFDGDEDDDSGRSGSAEPDDEDEKDWKKLALGTGSGGVKGRRKGMVFKCENCNKVGQSSTRLTTGIPTSQLFDQASMGAQPTLEGTHPTEHVQASTSANARGESMTVSC